MSALGHLGAYTQAGKAATMLHWLLPSPAVLQTHLIHIAWWVLDQLVFWNYDN